MPSANRYASWSQAARNNFVHVWRISCVLVVPSSGDSRFSLVCSAAAALHLREQPTLDQVLQTAVSGPLACAVRQSLPYRFEHERLILGEEMLRSHGWQMGAKVPDCSGLTEAEFFRPLAWSCGRRSRLWLRVGGGRGAADLHISAQTYIAMRLRSQLHAPRKSSSFACF